MNSIDAAETSGSSEQRRKGPRRARNLAAQLAEGRALTPHKRALLRLSCRLLVHVENISNRLYQDGEIRTDGEAKQALGRLLDLNKAVSDNFARIFEDDNANDPFALLSGGQR